MLEDSTYREWTKVFNEGSYYKGDWSEGSKILFLGPDPETGKEGGMVAYIKENRLHEYISIEHFGFIEDGIESQQADWAPSYENYTFTDQGDSTLLEVDMDIDEKWADEMNAMWPQALERLKELSEQSA